MILVVGRISDRLTISHDVSVIEKTWDVFKKRTFISQKLHDISRILQYISQNKRFISQTTITTRLGFGVDD